MRRASAPPEAVRPMTRTRMAPIAALLALLLLGACTAPSAGPLTATAEPTPSQTAAPTESPEPTESAEPTDDGSGSAEPSSSPIGGERGFAFEANAEADALFLDRFSCQNLEDGYQVEFPAVWNANAEFGEIPPCSWFAAEEYEADDLPNVPEPVAIVMTREDADLDAEGEESGRAEGIIGGTQEAYRVTVENDEVTGYYYVVQLGPTLEEGPNLIAYTTSEMGDDFDLNRAVLDRMMATMEFIGVIQ